MLHNGKPLSSSLYYVETRCDNPAEVVAWLLKAHSIIKQPVIANIPTLIVCTAPLLCYTLLKNITIFYRCEALERVIIYSMEFVAWPLLLFIARIVVQLIRRKPPSVSRVARDYKQLASTLSLPLLHQRACLPLAS